MCGRGVAWLRLGVRLTAAGGRTETEKHLEAALGGSGKQLYKHQPEVCVGGGGVRACVRVRTYHSYNDSRVIPFKCNYNIVYNLSNVRLHGPEQVQNVGFKFDPIDKLYIKNLFVWALQSHVFTSF